MTRTKKIVAVVALVPGSTAAAAIPALAENQAGVTPQNTHATAYPLDNHVG